MAAAGDHHRRHVPGGDRYQTHDRRRRFAKRMERGDGDRDSGHAAAGVCGGADAEMVCQRAGGYGEVADFGTGFKKYKASNAKAQRCKGRKGIS